MKEWLEKHSASGHAIVSSDEGLGLSYGELRDVVNRFADQLRASGGQCLGYLECENRVGSIVSYLAGLAAEVPLILGESRSNVSLLQRYHPELAIMPIESALPPDYVRHCKLGLGYELRVSDRSELAPPPHPDLALLLNTSGSTGSPKLVRLSAFNLLSNADSIVEYLGIGRDDRSIQSLPMHYSYGLSLINSHLAAGGCTVLTDHSFIRPEFWKVVDDQRCTSFAGVPYMYEMMRRLRYCPSQHESIRYFTQAGGPLKDTFVRSLHEKATAAGKQFFVMYGQTEATARISYVPPDRLGEKIGSIGCAIPQGRIELEPLDDNPAVKQLVYRGPNVMLGYAECRADLARHDDLQGTLSTGDLARVDDEGFFYVCGRLNRFAKLFGKRISLAEVERETETRFGLHAAVLESTDRLIVFAERAPQEHLSEIRSTLASFLQITPTAIAVESIDRIPRTSSGKKNYQALKA